MRSRVAISWSSRRSARFFMAAPISAGATATASCQIGNSTKKVVSTSAANRSDAAAHLLDHRLGNGKTQAGPPFLRCRKNRPGQISGKSGCETVPGCAAMVTHRHANTPAITVAAMITLSPDGENLAALESRFASTCIMRSYPHSPSLRQFAFQFITHLVLFGIGMIRVQRCSTAA